MSPIKHAFRAKSGIFYFRIAVPKPLRENGSLTHHSIYLSLKTYDPKVAEFMSKALWVELQMAMKSQPNKTKAKIDSDIRARLERYRDYMADTHESEQKDFYWGTPAFEEIIENCEIELRELASLNLLEELEDDFSNLYKLTALAEKTKTKIKQNRIQNIADQAVMTMGSSRSSADDLQSLQLKTVTDTPAITLQAILDDYLHRNDVDDAKWSVKNRDKEQSHFQFLIDTAGNVFAQEFDQAHLREFLKGVEGRKRMLGGKQVPITAKTRNEYIATCRRVFAFAEARYPDIGKNLFANKAILYKGTGKKRNPFTKSDLKAMFSHSVFTNGTFQHPYQYWIPLLALYTGARANELAQLHTADVVSKDGVVCISLNAGSSDKGLKNETSNRIVPLHPKLIELGFQRFVDLLNKRPAKWKDENGYYRLFRGLTLDKARGGYGKNLSRWFNGTFDKKTKKQTGFKHRVGVAMSDEYKKDFHSFRHTCATALDNADVQPNIAYRITGHTTDDAIKKLYQSAGGRYRHSLEVKKMHKEICKLNFDDVLSNVKPFFDVGGKKKCLQKKQLT